MSKKYIWFMDAVEAANKTFQNAGYGYQSPIRISVIGAIHLVAKNNGMDIDSTHRKVDGRRILEDEDE